MQPGKKVRLTNGTTATVKKEIGHGGQDDMSLAGCINPKAIANGIKIIDLEHNQASLEESL